MNTGEKPIAIPIPSRNSQALPPGAPVADRYKRKTDSDSGWEIPRIGQHKDRVAGDKPLDKA
jgi:hypothetical protein